MQTHSQDIHLQAAQLRLLLASDDDGGDGQLSGQQLHHLEHCQLCQERLASVSGEGDWLRELRDTLETEVLQETSEFDACSPPSVGPHSVAIVLENSPADDDRPDISRMTLDFLEPPRHPELLGRLGRYDIERLIGAGGFGVVLKAHDTELHRVVALKVLAPHLMSSGAARRRFAREAQAAAGIQHENVTPIFDVVAEDRVAYLVMQFIAGMSVQERIDRNGPLSVEETLRIGVQVSAGLAAAHAQGVVHRDVKPANILLESSLERVVISDFGLAQTADDASLTRSGVITGTPHYMSPEQSLGDAVDARSDLFSLGSVLYFMLTGHPPFRARQVMAVLNRICTESPRSIDQVRRDVPYEVEQLIERLLQKNPADRFADAEAVHLHLLRLLSDFRQGRLRRRPTVMAWLRRRRPLLTGIIATGVCVAAGFAIRNSQHTTDSSAGQIPDTQAAVMDPSAAVTRNKTDLAADMAPGDMARGDMAVAGDSSAMWASESDVWTHELRLAEQELEYLERVFKSSN